MSHGDCWDSGTLWASRGAALAAVHCLRVPLKAPSDLGLWRTSRRSISARFGLMTGTRQGYQLHVTRSREGIFAEGAENPRIPLRSTDRVQGHPIRPGETGFGANWEIHVLLPPRPRAPRHAPLRAAGICYPLEPARAERLRRCRAWVSARGPWDTAPQLASQLRDGGGRLSQRGRQLRAD